MGKRYEYEGDEGEDVEVFVDEVSGRNKHVG